MTLGPAGAVKPPNPRGKALSNFRTFAVNGSTLQPEKSSAIMALLFDCPIHLS